MGRGAVLALAFAVLCTTAVVVFLQDAHSREALLSRSRSPSSSVLIDHHPRRGRMRRAAKAQGAKDASPSGGQGAEQGKKVAVKTAAKPVKTVRARHNMEKHKKWTKAQKMVEEQVLAAMAQKHARMEAAAKKSALSDYWKSIKTSLHTEKHRLNGFGAAEALDRANREMYDDSTAEHKRALRNRRQHLLHEKLSEMSQEKEMESESAYKDIQSHHLDYNSCNTDCQEARGITAGVTSSGGDSYFGSSYHDNFMSRSDSYDDTNDDDNFAAGR